MGLRQLKYNAYIPKLRSTSTTTRLPSRLANQKQPTLFFISTHRWHSTACMHAPIKPRLQFLHRAYGYVVDIHGSANQRASAVHGLSCNDLQCARLLLVISLADVTLHCRTTHSIIEKVSAHSENRMLRACVFADIHIPEIPVTDGGNWR